MESNVESKKIKFQNVVYHIVTFFVIFNLLVSATLYYLHVNGQKAGVLEEIMNKSRAVGHTVTSTLQKSMNLGVPLDEIIGGNSYLDKKNELSKELEYMVITDTFGKVIAHTSGAKDNLKGHFVRFSNSSISEQKTIEPFNIFNYYNMPIKIEHKDQLVGYLHLGLSNKALDNSLSDIFYNIAIILIVAMVIGYELLRFIFKNSVDQPLIYLLRGLQSISSGRFKDVIAPISKEKICLTHERINNIITGVNDQLNQVVAQVKKIPSKVPYLDLITDSLRKIYESYQFSEHKTVILPVQPSVQNVRLVAFLLILAEAILVTMIPSYASQFHQNSWMFSKQLIASSPVITFMLFASFSMPFAPKLSFKYGFRKTILIGLFVTAVGYLGAFLTDSLIAFLVTRSISAIGYGIVFVTCQNYIAAYSSASERIKSYSIFVVASGSAFLCGTPIGGILIDNIGYSLTFLFAFISILSAMIVTQRDIIDLPGLTLTQRRDVSNSMKDLIKEKELRSAVFLSGFPTRLIYPSLISYLYPMYLVYLGNSQSMVGRILMIFGLLVFIVSPLSPYIVMRFKKPESVAIVSSFAIVGVLLIGYLFGNTIGVVIGICLYTIASVVHLSSMMAILDKFSEENSQKYTKDSVLGFYFISERIAMISGPALVSIVLSVSNFSKTMLVMAGCLFICNAVYTYAIWSAQSKNKTKGVK